MPQYSQKETQKLLDSLPLELKDVLFSPDTAETIGQICERNNVSEENITRVAGLVGNILTGLLPPKELSSALRESFDINQETAEKISHEVNRFVLYPVKNILTKFYREIEFVPGGRIEIKPAAGTEEIKKESADDVYREFLE